MLLSNHICKGIAGSLCRGSFRSPRWRSVGNRRRRRCCICRFQGLRGGSCLLSAAVSFGTFPFVDTRSSSCCCGGCPILDCENHLHPFLVGHLLGFHQCAGIIGVQSLRRKSRFERCHSSDTAKGFSRDAVQILDGIGGRIYLDDFSVTVRSRRRGRRNEAEGPHACHFRVCSCLLLLLLLFVVCCLLTALLLILSVAVVSLSSRESTSHVFWDFKTHMCSSR